MPARGGYVITTSVEDDDDIKDKKMDMSTSSELSPASRIKQAISR